jgi:hypothetical protein
LPRHVSRSQLRAVASFIVAGTFVLAANVAAGTEPGQASPIPDSAFRPVVVPSAPASRLQAEAPLSAAAPNQGFVPKVDLPELYEPLATTTPVERAQPKLPTSRPIVVKPAPPAPKYTHSLKGYASYYCRAGSSPCTSGYPDGGGVQAYAAAGPKLRAALGDWHGRVVSVDGIRVKLIDWCQCYQGQSNEKLLDLYYDVFARTGSPVTIRW